jgi:ribosomal 30S subunit maturation factor RimM
MVARLELVAPAVALPPGFGLLAGGRRLVVNRSSVHDRESLLIGIDGIDGVESAEELRGEDLSATREDVLGVAGLLPADLFTGMKVIWKHGCGRVTGADLDAANPLLRVEHQGGEFPLPVSMALAGAIDWRAAEMRLDLPEGLTDLEGGF